jgi:hypothetical protein
VRGARAECTAAGDPTHETAQCLTFSWRAACGGASYAGVEVYGREYSYAGHYHTENTGLKNSAPRDTSWLHDAVFRERLFIGYVRCLASRRRGTLTDVRLLQVHEALSRRGDGHVQLDEA